MNRDKETVTIQRIFEHLTMHPRFAFLEDTTTTDSVIIMENHKMQHQFYINGGLRVLSTVVYDDLDGVSKADTLLTFLYNKQDIREIYTAIEDKSGRPIFPEWWSLLDK